MQVEFRKRMGMGIGHCSYVRFSFLVPEHFFGYYTYFTLLLYAIV
jgi:hypothetical protein